MTIAEMRKEKGLTQQALADRLGVMQPTVAMWETGQSVPGFRNLVRLSEILGADLAELARSFPKQKEPRERS